VNTTSEAQGRLPVWLDELLNNCPTAGDGVHLWQFCVARQLLPHFDEQTTFELMLKAACNCGRPLGKLKVELASQIKNAAACQWRPLNPTAFKPAGTPAPLSEDALARVAAWVPRWPEPDEAKIRQIIGSGFGLVDLYERSPIRFQNDSYAEEIIDTLFPGNPLLCVGKSSYQFATRRRELWRGHLHRLSFVVPNPMIEVIGQTADGRLSEHTKEATARRVYLVIEFDFSEFGRDGKTPTRWSPLVREWKCQGTTVTDACAALHLHLALLLPLICAVHSGGKSVHGWYGALSHSGTELRHFMAYAVCLGADRATWTRSQFVRIPDGLRANGERQTCYYLDPGKAVKL
jgi:hypothetical protein